MATSEEESRDRLRRVLEAALGGDLNSLGDRLRDLGDTVDRMLNASADDPDAARAAAAEIIAAVGLHEEQAADVRDALLALPPPVHEVSDHDTGGFIELETTINIAVNAEAALGTGRANDAAILIFQEEADDPAVLRQRRLALVTLAAVIVIFPVASAEPTTAEAIKTYLLLLPVITRFLMWLFPGNGS